MGIEDIKTIYDTDTQKLIDFYNNMINEIAGKYNKIMDSAKSITYYSHHGGVEKLKQEFEREIKPFQDKLLNIYLTAIPIYIIKKKDGDNNCN